MKKIKWIFLPLFCKTGTQAQHTRDTKGEFHRKLNFGAHYAFLFVQLPYRQVIMIR